MARGSLSPILLDLTGGRNGGDSPLALALPNQCVEALNVDWSVGQIAHRRGGSTSLALTGGTAPTAPISALTRYVPGADDTLAEMWLIDNAATPIVKRLAGGTAWADVTLSDAIASRPQDAQFAVLNGKLFIAYDSAVDRLHVYDPGLAAPRVRRVGLDPGLNAPTVANTGAGTYAATLRYYRVRFIQATGAIRTRVSEPTPSVSFTPSGGGTAARITRPTAPGEQETHWIVEGSTDNTTFYELNSSGTVIATTTYDDSVLPSAYSLGDLSDSLGTYTLPTSVKYVITDTNRLLMAGAWESGGISSRVWWSPVLGSGSADDERIPVLATSIRSYADVGEKNGGGITGLGGPVELGIIYAFKYREIWKFSPTGDVLAPYIVRQLVGGNGGSSGIGNIDGAFIVRGVDDAGNASVYFWSEVGPYRIGSNGLEALWWDIRDLVATMNLSATNKVGHGIFYPKLMQVWWWIATGTSNDPDTKVIFDIRKGRRVGDGWVRGGWAVHDSLSAACRASCMFANTVGTTMSHDLKPYASRASGATILKCDTTDQTDNGTAFQSYVTTKPITLPTANEQLIGFAKPIIIATALDHAQISVSAIRDFGLETTKAMVSLAPDRKETRVIRNVEGLEMAEASAIQLQIGDRQAVSVPQWTIDAITVPVADHGAK
jgi:hypothetical protein